MEKITVSTVVNVSVQKAWELRNGPEHITQRYFASDDREAPKATNDLRVGGIFVTSMSAKDKSAAFDFTGIYETVEENKLIEYWLSDGRKIRVEFETMEDSTKVTEIFDPETENSRELQQWGWQSILDNFKKYAEKL